MLDFGCGDGRYLWTLDSLSDGDLEAGKPSGRTGAPQEVGSRWQLADSLLRSGGAARKASVSRCAQTRARQHSAAGRSWALKPMPCRARLCRAVSVCVRWWRTRCRRQR